MRSGVSQRCSIKADKRRRRRCALERSTQLRLDLSSDASAAHHALFDLSSPSCRRKRALRTRAVGTAHFGVETRTHERQGTHGNAREGESTRKRKKGKDLSYARKDSCCKKKLKKTRAWRSTNEKRQIRRFSCVR
eukprot:2244387-Pleurochrysis_carterae.AAC.1